MAEAHGFDYGQISGSKRTEVQEATRRIHELLARSADNAVQIGIRRRSAKAAVFPLPSFPCVVP